MVLQKFGCRLEAQEAPQKSSRVSAMILSGIQKLEVGLWGALHHSIIVLLYDKELQHWTRENPKLLEPPPSPIPIPRPRRTLDL